jgi:predicted PurR-regulated permease PerM
MPPASGLMTTAIAVAMLYFAKTVLVPVAVAILLSVVFTPFVKRLERIRIGRLGIGRIGSVIAVVGVLSGLFTGIGWIVWNQGSALAERLPEYREIAREKLREPLESLEQMALELREMTGAEARQAPRVRVVEGESEVVGLLRDWAGSVASLLGTAGLVIVLLSFLLLEREELRDRLVRLAGRSEMRATTSALRDATERVSRYLRALALLNFAHGLLVGIGLWVIGLPGAFVFGLLSGVLRFVPYVGPWIAALAPIALSLVVFDGFTVALVTTAFFTAIELVSNNVLEPWVFGTTVGISPFGVMLSAIFWTWLWGPIGLVLATPLTVCLVVLGRHVPQLAALSILLGDSQALQPFERLYERIVARDSDEATKLVRAHAKSAGALAAWDAVVMPALRMLDRDRRLRLLGNADLAFARETLESLLKDVPDREASPVQSTPPPLVLCMPARAWGDEILCESIARFLAAAGLPARPTGRLLTTELIDEVVGQEHALVCVSSLPSARASLRLLLKRMRSACPDTTVVVGLWGEEPSTAEREWLGSGPRIHYATTLENARDLLLGLASLEPARPDRA